MTRPPSLHSLTVMPQHRGGTRLLWPDVHIDLVIQAPPDAQADLPILFSPGLQWTPQQSPNLAGPALRLRLFPWTLPHLSALLASAPTGTLSEVLACLAMHDSAGAANAGQVWLSEQLQHRAPNALELAVNTILMTPGRVSLPHLEALTCTSERLLQRQCRAELGCTLAGLQRLIRFERTLLALAAQPVPALAELALTTGFADQAHLSREVRRFTGRSPLKLWREVHAPEKFKTPDVGRRMLKA